MAKTELRLPPDIIRAMENVANRGGTVRLQIVHGSWKVQEEKRRLIMARET